MVIGHQNIIQFLKKSINNKRVVHAYLFIGPEHLGKRTVAFEFTKALQCLKAKDGLTEVHPPNNMFSVKNFKRYQKRVLFNFCDRCISCLKIEKKVHPDVLVIESEKLEKGEQIKEKEISIEKIRDVQHKLALSPFYGPYKIVIIEGAERLTREAANAFLKTLEEPTLQTVIILISSQSKDILSTIVSRCLLIKFSVVSQKVIATGLREIFRESVEQAVIEKAVKLAAGRPGIAINYLMNPQKISEEEKIFTDLLQLFRADLTQRFKYAEFLAKDLVTAQEVLSKWVIFFRDLFLKANNCDNLIIRNDFINGHKLINEIIQKMSPRGIKNLIEETQKTKSILNNSSFNSRLALEVLMLKF